MKRILVAGNTGYIGPAVVRQLRRSYPGAEIVGVDIGYFAHCLSSPVLPEVALDVQIFADARHPRDEWFRSADSVIYLAALSNDNLGKINEDVTAEVNWHAAVHWAEEARRHGARSFVFASSCSVYGFAQDAPRTEDSEVNPLTAYARSKVRAERELAPLASDAFTITSLRFATACGMAERVRLDLVLNDFVASAMATGAITILSDGTPWRPLIEVGDMARAIDWAVGRCPTDGGTALVVNTGRDDWNFRVRDLADAVAREIPGTAVHVNPEAVPDRRSYRVSFVKFRALAPHHQPVAELGGTIRTLRDGLAAIGFHDPAFRTSRWVRLRVLDELKASGQLTPDLSWAAAAPLLPR